MKSFIALALVSLPLAALAAGTFTLESAEVKPGATIAAAQLYKGFGCDGSNVSPSLAWKNAPAGTKSFGVTVYDPDAPTGSGWWHWIVFNIPAEVTSLPVGVGNPASGQTPKGAVQSKTDFGKPGYGGPCPPAGDKPHHYQITVFAVDVEKLPGAKNKAASALVSSDLRSHSLAKATLTGFYGR